MDHTLHARLDDTELTDAVLAGASIYGPDNETVGTISHLHGRGRDAEAIIDVGGFLGIGAKPVALSVRDLDLMRDENGTVHGLTSFTKEQLKSMPEHHH